MAGLRSVAGIAVICALSGAALGATDDDPFAPKAGAPGATDTPPATGTTTPTAPSTDTPAAPATPVAPATGTPAAPAPQAAECENVNPSAEKCRDANTSLLLKAAGYTLIAVLLLSILRMWWNKRGTSTAGVRYLFPMVLAGGVAGTLAGLDPMRSTILKCCIANQDFVSNIHLQDSEVARAVLLGALPAIGVFVVVAAVEKLVKR